jgi:UDP-N-acetylmuramoyl-tripeptide--D-alanyl-D-alanine ligase
MKIKDIIEATKGKLITGNIEDECNSFCKDTRILKAGEAYIGIKGENFDGNLLWKQAFEKGASTIIVQGIQFTNEEKKEYENKNIIEVENTIKAIADIAKYKRETYGKEFPVIGVTGSVGKTSTKDIIANVVSQKYKTLKTEGNNNNDIGLPFTLFRLNDHEAAVIEMGMNHLNEINKLTQIAQPTISVITNIGTSHIGNLGSRENILKAKLEILEGMDKKILVINNDNDLLHDWKEKNNIKNPIITYGIDNVSDYQATNLKYDKDGSHFKLNNDLVDINVIGKHFIYNSLVAFAIADLFKINHK